MSGRATIAIIAFATVVPVTLAGGCNREPANDIAVDVYAWARCEECQMHEKDNVVRRGTAAVPQLRTVLLDGMPHDHMNRLRASLGLPPLGSTVPVAGDTTARILEIKDVVTSYRVRAATALGEIGGSAARRALCEARAGALPAPPLGPALDTALVHVGGTCP